MIIQAIFYIQQTERAAMDLYYLYEFWKLLHTEVMPPHTDSKGKYFSMHQLRWSERNILNV